VEASSQTTYQLLADYNILWRSAKALSRYSDMVDVMWREQRELLDGASDEARLQLRQWELPEALQVGNRPGRDPVLRHRCSKNAFSWTASRTRPVSGCASGNCPRRGR